MSRLAFAVATAALLAVSACSSGATTPRMSASPSTSPPVASASRPTASTSTLDRPSSTGPAAEKSTTTGSDATSTSAGATTTAAATHTPAQVLAAMTEAQRVGQLLMVDCPSTAVASATVTAITKYHVGSVILDGNSSLSVSQTRALTDSLQSNAPSSAGLFISTDQEGGLVRRMRGYGFSTIPSALTQGTYSTATLQADAKKWGAQLHAAGINVDLAPVLDTVPSGSTGNPPIGDLDREYGHYPSHVASRGTAVARGMAAAGVDATGKHFPGLGRVAGNTDTTSGVKDFVTTRHDAYLQPFASAVNAGLAFVMMSTAIYTRIDARFPAAFSSTIMTGMLRGDLGFRGVIISDDLGSARQVSGYSVGARAVDFVKAGGDIVLTVNASQASTMTAALLARTRLYRTFKNKVDAAALAVLTAKQARGLLG